MAIASGVTQSPPSMGAVGGGENAGRFRKDYPTSTNAAFSRIPSEYADGCAPTVWTLRRFRTDTHHPSFKHLPPTTPFRLGPLRLFRCQNRLLSILQHDRLCLQQVPRLHL